MLLNLHVKNLALIDETEVDFGRGLNILTGETGAGKSLIIGSVNLALGERVPKGIVRNGADSALVELTFESNARTDALLAEHGVEGADGQITMARKLSANGRSICRINGETVSAALMRETASALIDIHGQHAHESLLQKKNHRKYLDDFAEQEIHGLLEKLAQAYHAFRAAEKELAGAAMDTEQQNREISFLNFEIEEIEAAGLVPGEDDALEEEFRKLSHGQRILEALNACQQACAKGSENASEQIGRAVADLGSAAGYDDAVAELRDRLAEIDSLLADFNLDLSAYLMETDNSQERFAEVQERLNEINRLKAKYGSSIAKILAEKEQKQERLQKLQDYEAYLQGLEKEVSARRKKLQELCDRVTMVRKEQGAIFADRVREALLELNFQEVRFEVQIAPLDDFTVTGLDEVIFMISVNPGEEIRPLHDVASGGELSRIMLAIKTVLAQKDEIDTLIFDEIDTGISGRTAQKVAEKMKETAGYHQIICITHLPQIAAKADVHFLIEKGAQQGRTVTDVRLLEEEETIRELARMLSGAEITDAVLQNARELRSLGKERN